MSGFFALLDVQADISIEHTIMNAIIKRVLGIELKKMHRFLLGV
jgi:hypothetical protein